MCCGLDTPKRQAVNPFDFFVQKVCLTTGGKEWKTAQGEFQRYGLFPERFDAVPAIGPHQSFNLGLKAVLQQFYDNGTHSLLFLEDDCEFRNIEQLWPALQELPANWDIFYLGCNIKSEATKMSQRIYKITDAWTTHAVAFTRGIVKHFLDNVPHEDTMMSDNWLGSQLHMFNAYTVKPVIAIQRPRFSGIWGAHADYSQVWKESEAKMV